jgi:predicted RNA-binding Zn-ribbon protein involved in translation (DUF1610 family)
MSSQPCANCGSALITRDTADGKGTIHYCPNLCENDLPIVVIDVDSSNPE